LLYFKLTKATEGPGGGYLLFKGCFSKTDKRWNFLVDIWLISVDLLVISLVVVFDNPLLIFAATMFLVAMDLINELLIEYVTVRKFNEADLDSRRNFRNDAPTVEPTSVYADPSIPFGSILFQVLVPQTIIMYMYIHALTRESFGNFTYAVLGAFLAPVTLVTCDLPSAHQDVEFNTDLLLAKKFRRRVKRNGKYFNIADKYLSLRLHIHYTVNYSFPAIMILTLPILLAKADSPIDFVLEAMAVLFVLTLDDIPPDARHKFALTQELVPDEVGTRCSGSF